MLIITCRGVLHKPNDWWKYLWQLLSGRNYRRTDLLLALLNKTLCDECERKKTDNKKIKNLSGRWIWKMMVRHASSNRELSAWGLLPVGVVVIRCIEGNAPCRGCYGPPPDSTDPGAKMMSAIGNHDRFR